jgi:3-keto-disaccharide hydrolase
MRFAQLAPIFMLALAGALLAWTKSAEPDGLEANSQDPGAQEPVGYTDTPYLPYQQWRVHDKNRPVPTVVQPGTASTPDSPGNPPSDALVLFDGSDLSAWTGGAWAVADGSVTVNGTGDLQTKEAFGDVQLHVEWRSPIEPGKKSQGRGNSGVFLMGRYEIQVLNSFQNRTYADGQAASIYGQYPPLVNACRPSAEWQSYDIVFMAPKFSEKGEVVQPAHVTAFHNGVLVQNHQALLGPTTHKQASTYQAHPAKLPIKLQDHGNAVSYRNIWLRRL